MGVWKELEVTVLSAQDLKNVKLTGGTMNPYCVAWIYPHSKVAGAVNNGGGVNPTWNSIIKLQAEESLLEQGNANVTVEIYNHGKFSNKFVGSAVVPVADVKSTQGRGGAYEVRTKSGKSKGQINVAVKVGRTLTEQEATKAEPPVMAYPAGMGMGMGQGSGQYTQQQGQSQFYPQQQYPQQQYVYQQARPRRSGMMGGPGLGLGAGLLGGMLLGGAMDGGMDGGGCGGGGGGCGGGCGG